MITGGFEQLLSVANRRRFLPQRVQILEMHFTNRVHGITYRVVRLFVHTRGGGGDEREGREKTGEETRRSNDDGEVWIISYSPR